MKEVSDMIEVVITNPHTSPAILPALKDSVDSLLEQALCDGQALYDHWGVSTLNVPMGNLAFKMGISKESLAVLLDELEIDHTDEFVSVSW